MTKIFPRIATTEYVDYIRWIARRNIESMDLAGDIYGKSLWGNHLNIYSMSLLKVMSTIWTLKVFLHELFPKAFFNYSCVINTFTIDIPISV